MGDLMKYFLLILPICGGCICLQWPKQIRRCSLSDPNLNKCLFDAAKSAIPHLSKGIKEWNFPALEPFSLRNLTFKNNARPLDVVFNMRNGSITDTTSSYSLQKMWFDKKKNELHFESVHKRLRMSGDYDLRGQVFSFDVNGGGHFDLDFRDVKHYHVAKFTPSKTKKAYHDINVVYKLKGLGQFIFGLKNSSLPPSLEQGVVRIVNENQDIVTSLMIPTAEQGFEIIVNHAIRPLFRRFKFSDVFLP